MIPPTVQLRVNQALDLTHEGFHGLSMTDEKKPYKTEVRRTGLNRAVELWVYFANGDVWKSATAMEWSLHDSTFVQVGGADSGPVGLALDFRMGDPS